MAVWNPKPLSWGERMELAQQLRKEAAEKIAEAQRIEDGLSADQDAVYAAIEAARARIEAKKVGAGSTATQGDLLTANAKSTGAARHEQE